MSFKTPLAFYAMFCNANLKKNIQLVTPTMYIIVYHSITKPLIFFKMNIIVIKSASIQPRPSKQLRHVNSGTKTPAQKLLSQ